MSSKSNSLNHSELLKNLEAFLKSNIPRLKLFNRPPGILPTEPPVMSACSCDIEFEYEFAKSHESTHPRPFVSACRQMEFGVQAIFGPSDPILGAHIQSICEALDVPHLEARIDFEPLSKELSINLHPSQEHMNRAFKDLMVFLNWTKVAIIYEEDYGESGFCRLGYGMGEIQTVLSQAVKIFIGVLYFGKNDKHVLQGVKNI